MQFRTPIEPLHMQGSISHSTPVMLIGSCFSTNIGMRMQQDLFDISINPFGTLYNPVSIESALIRIIENRTFTDRDIVKQDDMYHSFDCHSELSSSDRNKMLHGANLRLAEARDFIHQAKTIILTLGTAWVYYHNATGSIVANCHKFPSTDFMRKRLSVKETSDCISRIIRKIHTVNNDINIIFTVSPIRHGADGAHGNQLSKSTLLLGIDDAIRHNMKTIYFPAYELLMDDLRDYRFYAEDMRHPSETAIEYVYETFSQSFFDAATKRMADECRKYSRRLNHHRLSDDTTSYEKFQMATETERKRLIAKYPCLQKVLSKSDKYINSNQQ